MSEKVFYVTEYKYVDKHTDLKTLIGDLKIRLDQGYTHWEIFDYSHDNDPVYGLQVSKSRPETQEEQKNRLDKEYLEFKMLEERYFALKDKFGISNHE